MTHTSNPSTWEAEAGTSPWVQNSEFQDSQLGSETLSQKKITFSLRMQIFL